MRKWILLVALALWIWLLRGFVDTKALIVSSLAGPLLLVAGVSLARVMGPLLLRPGWQIAVFLVGLAMIAGALATLAPAAPAAWLTTTRWGWGLLDERSVRLSAAVDAGDVGLTRRLASRGLTDAEPLDPSGRPLIQRATTVEVLSALLDHGLDPDARDEEGRTLLMHARQSELVRALLAAGADVDARDREDATVADALPETLRAIVEVHAGRRLATRADEDASRRGRADWLTVTRYSAARLEGSMVTVEPPRVGRGDTATITATLANPSAEDRLLDVAATLGAATLFVAGSHDGAIENVRRPQLLQTIRWPVLSLPAHSQGRIALQIVTRQDAEARDLAVEWRVRTLPGRETETLRVAQPLSDGEPVDVRSAWAWGPPAALVALGLGLWLMVRRRRSRSASSTSGLDVESVGAKVAAAAAVVCGLVAALFAWSIAEPYLQFEPAACTVLDHRVRTYTYQTSGSIDGSRRAIASSSETRTGVAPLTAVRIEGATPVVATGFEVGFTGGSVQDLRNYPVGARVPCWVDPTFATRFTLVRRPSVGSLTGLFALTLLGLLLAAITRGLRPSAHVPGGRGAAVPRRTRRRRA